jgi:indole-3-glycerol phosphate synthase
MTILDDISAYKREEVAAAKARTPLTMLESVAIGAGPTRGFKAALEEARNDGRYGLIAEIKRASPSKGVIRADFDPPALARAYERGGATCLSVLTDEPSFQGSPQYLVDARSASTLPVLRKDFMLDSYQVTEARAWGADCILIIMAMVDDLTAKTLMLDAAHWGMDALVEVHDESELERALRLGAVMIGINNRDLKTFVTDLGVTKRLAQHVPRDKLVVAESGISSPDDLANLAKAGVTTILVGESLMRQTDVAAATQALIGAKFQA